MLKYKCKENKESQANKTKKIQKKIKKMLDSIKKICYNNNIKKQKKPKNNFKKERW